jgi:hypothetical protein
MNFIGLSSLNKSTTVLLLDKKLLFSEALYEKVPRLHQHLLTTLRGRGHPGRSQHSSHTGEQQVKLRHFFFSRLTRNKWQ